MKNDFEKELEKVKKHVEWLKKHPDQAKLFLQIIGVYDEDGNLTKEFGGRRRTNRSQLNLNLSLKIFSPPSIKTHSPSRIVIEK